MYLDEKRSSGKWWICAGLVGITIMAAFIATTLYLSQERSQTRIRPRFKHVQEIKEIHTISQEDEEEITVPPKLSSGPDPVTLDELVPIKTPVRKKSEAIYPSDWSEELTRPIVIDPQQDFAENFHLPGITPPNTQSPDVDMKDYEYEEESVNPLYTFLQKRLKDVYKAVGNRKTMGLDWLDVIDSVNESISKSNVTIVMNKLKEIYYNTSAPDVSMSTLIYPSRQSLLNNASSLLSFGLLAVDLFLLHNVQQIAIAEESTVGEKMRRDPEVVALSALFLPPEKFNELGRSRQELVDTTNTSKGLLQELLEFAQGVIRAVVNLGKAYRRTTTAEAQGRSNGKPSPLDCIWTLYCRNLDKTAKLNGPYGFLAKMNSLALRLMMGEFPVEQAVEKLFLEYTRGEGSLNCQQLFPRCGAEEAKQVVISTAMGDNRL